MKDIKDIGFSPVTSQEELQLQMLMRLDALCNMVSSLLAAYAEEKRIVVEENVIEEVKVAKKPTKSRKPVKKEVK